MKAPKYFAPEMDRYDINYTIIKQLPVRVKDILATIDYKDTDKISQTLLRIDASQKERETYQERASNSAKSASQVNNMQWDTRYDNRFDPRYPRQNQGRQNNSRENNFPNGVDQNWRQRDLENVSQRNVNSTRQEGGLNELTSSTEPHAHENNNTDGDGANMCAMSIVDRSEFLEELCWDVDGVEKEHGGGDKVRVVSPRIEAEVMGHRVNVLVDTGSDVTCISDKLYAELKRNHDFIPRSRRSLVGYYCRNGLAE